jgi:L-ascorbate metabolism protein UlaG (beta-lactamase superfamily)
MKIKKFGHCCLLIEENGVRIITDPGSYSKGQNDVKNIDLILITHSDMDHLDMSSLKIILENNPHAKIITNNDVGKQLTPEEISFEVVEDSQETLVKGITIQGYGKKHAVIYETIPQKDNTGYFISNKFFYPGDAFTKIDKPVEILGLTVSAPWMKFSESLDYARELKPKVCIPMHDSNTSYSGIISRVYPMVLDKFGIKFVNIELNKEYDF